MKWYVSKIIFQIICGTGDHTPQFDEQWRLVTAANEAEALDKSKNIGKSEQQCFSNEQQQIVQWKFINVTELFRLTGMVDGAEIFSRIEECDHPDSYLELQHKRAAMLGKTTCKKMLQLI